MSIETISTDVDTYGGTAVRRAAEYGQTMTYSFTDMLTKVSHITLPEDNGVLKSVSLLPGIHMDTGQPGLSHKKIMLVGCWPNGVEDGDKNLLRGEWVTEFRALAAKTQFPIEDVYYTTFVKHHVAGKKAAIPKEAVTDFEPLFKHELSIIKPELVILLGAKVLKAVFGAKATVDTYKNMTIAAEDSPLGIKTTTITDFSAIIHMPEMRGGIELDLARITAELRTNTTVVLDNVPIAYSYVSSLQELANELTAIEREYTDWLSIDCEWGGGNHIDGELRSIQFSWAPGEALVAVFNNAGMIPTELGNNKVAAWALIKKLIENGRTRLIGHFIRSDLQWLKHNGLDVTVPVVLGWDTALAGHLLDENWGQGLETYAARHTQMGRYELPLTSWIKQNKYDVEEFGYGGIPDDILYPYAAQDADATFRIFLLQYAEMQKPVNVKVKALFENVVMPATLPILEIEMTGMKVDVNRLELLAQKYTEKRAELCTALQTLLNWPEFNPDSPAQKAAALFGWVKPGSKSGPPVTATLRYFEPIRATNDKKWSEVIKTTEALAIHTPSTDRSVLTELLLNNKDDELLNTVLLYSAVSQTVKTFSGEFVLEEDEHGSRSHSIKGGLLPKLWSDGRVHTRIRQTVETGRYGHSDPNMAQLPKTAEDLVGKAFKDTGERIPSIRSCFTADPGWCLLDCDWVQAELFVMAWLSGDTRMQQKLRDPGSDFHSEVAIEMFRLDAPPADYAKGKKEWLKETNNSKYRTIAKTITFGIAYGRGAAAIKQAVYMEGILISLEEAQESITKFKDTFPDLAHWLENQQSKVESQGYVENGFGRRRRFEATTDKELIAHQKRQAMNAPIQGTVGDLMSLALVNLFMMRVADKTHLQYRVVMSVHDQVLVTCPIDQAEETLEVMRLAMCDRCKIPGTDLVLDIDPEVCIRWSEPLTDVDITAYPSLAKYKK